ncbi:hypothetical protein GCM10011316_39100 [Roseibium aquae]|uniref:DUF3592 domain-containing protein n=1 Tax=Roseibium aquae TaxID=1323746 RepID=A0A916X410_9HYPH|nr:DUF3592 domain-containing protein [Roseibium aquae]GGB63422.1 hypothetical protein GCM10011316_39100 [Roseibium aquae]
MRSNGFVLGTAFIAVAGIAIVFGILRSGAAGEMERYGVRVAGVVVEKRTAQVRRTSGGVAGYDTEWLLRYRYEVAGGASVEEERAVPRAFWETLAVGESVDLRYLPRDPRRHDLVDDEIASEAFAFFAGGGAFGAAGLALIAASAVAASRTARVLARGVERDAEVVAIEQLDSKSASAGRWRVRYRYTDEAGVTHVRAAFPTGGRAKPPEVRARIRILVDPARPSDSRWVGEV